MESRDEINSNNEVANSVETRASDSSSKDEDVVVKVIADSPSVECTIIYNKDKYVVSMPLASTILQLKDKLFNVIGVPSKMQKIMIKGLAKDNQTLESLNVNSSSKIMVVGAKLLDVVAVSIANFMEDSSSSSSVKEPLCKEKLHMNVLKRGIPDDAMVGILDIKYPLPQYPLSGMLNEYGKKVRLTFKLELDQLWIGTKEQTLMVDISTIIHVVSEPIEGHAEYHILGLQFGTTEASYYWVYWVPAQYIDSIKEALKIFYM